MATSRFLKAFFASAAGTGISRILGAARDMTLASVLGAGQMSDSFYLAFGIPNMFRRFVADEGLTGAMIPALSEARKEEGEQATHLLANQLLGMILIANFVLCAVCMAFPEAVVFMFAPSWIDQPEKWNPTVVMTRWMFPFVSMVSFVSFFEGLLNDRGHFFIPKMAPGVVSAGMVFFALYLSEAFSQPGYAVAAGVIAGGTLHVLIHIPVILKLWGRVWPSFNFANPRVRRVTRELMKVIAIGIFAQINLLILRQLATSLPETTVTYYWNATRVTDLAQGIIAVAIGSALLPSVSKSVAEEDWSTLRTQLVSAVRLAAFVLLPAAVVLLFFAMPAVSMLFRRGEYTFADVQFTAEATQFLVPFMLAAAGINIIKKVYFALNDRKTLLIVGGCGVALTGLIGLAAKQQFGLIGLVSALSISTVFQLLIYVLVLHRRLGENLGLGELVSPLFTMLLCCAPVAVVGFFLPSAADWSTGTASYFNIFIFATALTSSALAYLSLAYLLGLKEVHAITQRLGGRFTR